MKVLFIGGTGTISQACTELAVARGMQLTLVNRGKTDQPIPSGVRILTADIRQHGALAAAIGDERFDVAVDWIAYTPEHVEADIAALSGRVGQYIFISSASAYQKPPVHYLVTESTPLHNQYWQYSRNKIACEMRLMEAYRTAGFPVTIVRPSFTYDRRLIPFAVGGCGYTVVGRMRQGRKIIVHGDGQSLWTMTHNSDFAKGFVGLLGSIQAIGESFHITSDEVLTWDQIYRSIAQAAGVADPRLVHIPSELINAFDPATGAGLLGDKACSMVFDNSKIRRIVPDFRSTVPFTQGIRESIAWYDADVARQTIDPKVDSMIDRIIDAYERAVPR